MSFSKVKISLLTIALACFFVGPVRGLKCGKSSAFDNQDFFSCPRPYDNPKAVFCCKGNTCCENPFTDGELDAIGKKSLNELEQETNEILESLPTPQARSLGKSLVKLVGFVILAIVIILVVCVVCCCCCPFCLLAKRRRQGQVMRNGGEDYENNTQRAYPPQQQSYPQQSPYPMQSSGGAMYPPQNQGYPPVSPYPPQQDQGYPLGVQPPYPPQQNYPAYPPPYTQQQSESYHQQPAYNPNY